MIHLRCEIRGKSHGTQFLRAVQTRIPSLQVFILEIIYLNPSLESLVTPSTEIAVLIYYMLCFYFLSADLDSARISLRAVLSALEPGPCLWQHLLSTSGAKLRLEPPSRIDILQEAYEETREELEVQDANLSWVSVEDSVVTLRVADNG
jgi:hypothetical protein